MFALDGDRDGNTLVATDESLRNFHGGEILIRVVQNNTRQEKASDNEKNEKLSALKAIRGVLGLNKPLTIADIRAERLGL